MLRKEETANGFLEMLIFAPAALFLLLTSIDCAMAIREKGILLDAIRSGLHEQALVLRDLPSSTASLFEDRGFDLAATEQPFSDGRSADLARAAAVTVGGNILRALGTGGGSADFRVESRVVAIHLDSASGRLTDFSFVGPLYTFPENSTFALQTRFADFVARSQENYLQSLLNRSESLSAFAVPLTPRVGRGSRPFLPVTYALFLEVTAASRTLDSNRGSLFGRMNGIQEFALVPLRSPMRSSIATSRTNE